jgi:small conductance mechanosensitive channel
MEVACAAMPAGHLVIGVIADTAAQWIRAGVAILLAVVAVYVLKRVFDRRRRTLDLSPEVDTRLRFVQRLIGAAIIFIGLSIAMSQFARVDNLAEKLLASGAIVAAIVGFAARQTLANAVAGIMLVIAQPVRVGDMIEFEERYGEVEDITLSYTMIKTAGDQHFLIPNERFAGGILRNDTLGSPLVAFDVSVWIPAHADAGRAVEVLAAETGGNASVAEITHEGVRLSIGGDPIPPRERAGREADLRARCLARLRAEGLLPTPAGESAPPANS